MKLSERFLPTQMPDSMTDREHTQMPYVINTVFFLTVSFMLLFIFGIFAGATFEAGMLAVSCVAFSLTLVLIKKGKIKQATWCASAGLLFAQVIVTFIFSIEGNPYGLYRILSFVVIMSVTNFLISIQLNKIFAYFFVSLGIWIVGALLAGNQIAEEAKILYIAVTAIGIVAIIFETIILVFVYKMFGDLNNNILKEKERVHTALVKITNVLEESRQGLEVGNLLSQETRIANSEVTNVNETFRMLKGDAKNLTDTVTTVQKAITVIEQRSKSMQSSTQSQNVAITQSSTSLTEISANLSNINAIASLRRKKMNDFLSLLNGQKSLVQNALLEVKRVKESSTSIGGFIHTVEDIANQTGLLAMNASIEAAHAGSAGKGFAVIAQEIRKLSEETAKNAAHIGDALKINEKNVAGTAKAVGTFASQTEESANELEITIVAIEEILMGISSMDSGTREVMNSMQHIVEKSQLNGDLVEEVSEKIAEQGNAMIDISLFAKKLEEEIEGTNKQFENIRSALENIKRASMKNVQVSQSVNRALLQIEV